MPTTDHQISNLTSIACLSHSLLGMADQPGWKHEFGWVCMGPWNGHLCLTHSPILRSSSAPELEG
ncbi:hypothetical protein CPC08DRAFT_710359 [Agrocybe pediades]|nr:hypothetical protein CPC08DRAFT_710359 [Agrocybe pediades]